MLQIGDLLWVHKPFGSIYKVFDVRIYWIPNDRNSGSVNLSEAPADVENYWISRIYYYRLYSNGSGKIVNGSEPIHCGDRNAVPFDKQKLLAFHKSKVDKLRALTNRTDKQSKDLEKLINSIDNVTKNL